MLATVRKGRARACAAADAAAQQYRLRIARRDILKHSHNTTFRLVAPDGSLAVMKTHAPGSSALEQVRSEMQWLDALSRESDLLIPRPIRNRDGDLITRLNLNGDGQWL